MLQARLQLQRQLAVPAGTPLSPCDVIKKKTWPRAANRMMMSKDGSSVGRRAGFPSLNLNSTSTWKASGRLLCVDYTCVRTTLLLSGLTRPIWRIWSCGALVTGARTAGNDGAGSLRISGNLDFDSHDQGCQPWSRRPYRPLGKTGIYVGVPLNIWSARES